MDRYGDQGIKQILNCSADLYSFNYIIIKSNNNYSLWGNPNKYSNIIFGYNQKENSIAVYHMENDFSLDNLIINTGRLFAVQSEYFEKLGYKSIPKKNESGWTSWYQYYTDINPTLLSKQIENLKKLNVETKYFQIDDGWQEGIGSWIPNAKFKGQMKSLADKATASGMIPGLWLAPFIVEEKIVSTLPENWVKKDTNGNKIIAGRNPLWSGKYYSLDWKNPEVKNYLKKCFHTVIYDWGYKLLKLDFLYAAVLKSDGKLNKDLVESYRLLEELTDGAEILGCGAITIPEMPFKKLRIGADVAHKWEDKILANFIKYRERVSTIASLRNTVNRAIWNQYICENDPDVFFLKQKKLKLNKTEIHTLLLLNYCLGTVHFTSDDVSDYTPSDLELYFKQFPSIKKEIIDLEIVDKESGYFILQSNKKEYLLAYNLSDQISTFQLPKGDWILNKDLVKKIKLNKRETKILKKLKPSESLIYSTGHLMPGQEIAKISIDKNQLQITKSKFAKAKSKVFIRVAKEIDYLEFNNVKIKAKPWHDNNLITVEI